MELLNELKQKGIRLKVIGNNKLWLGPKAKLTPELIAKVKQHKQQIIKALPEQEVKSNFNMTLDEFEAANKFLKVRSDILNETIYFASSDEVAKKLKDEGFTIYTASELKAIAKRRLGANELRLIHEIKYVFDDSKIIQ